MYVPVGATDTEKRAATELACKMHPEAKGCEQFRPRSGKVLLLLALLGGGYWYFTERKKG